MRSTNLHSYATRFVTTPRTLFLPQHLQLRAIHVSETFVIIVVVVTNSVNLFTAAAAFRTALLTVMYFHGSRNSVVSTMPRTRAGRFAVRIPKKILFSSPKRPDRLLFNRCRV